MSLNHLTLLCIASMLEGEHDDYAMQLRKIAVDYERLERYADEMVAEAQESADAAEFEANQRKMAVSMEENALDVALDRVDPIAVTARRHVMRELHVICKGAKERH